MNKKGIYYYPQLDSRDCGSTCLRMVAKHYGKSYSLQRMKDAINTNTQALSNQLKTWEMTYALKRPIRGKVVFGNYWSTNQHVKVGDLIMIIVPDDASIPMGKITLPMQGAGKVKPGQRVNIKLTNYPYLEYGMIKGIVSRLSEVPNQSNYLVEVELPSGLKSNYNKQLHFDQEMTGTADIITEDMRLLQRTLSPLRSISVANNKINYS